MPVLELQALPLLDDDRERTSEMRVPLVPGSGLSVNGGYQGADGFKRGVNVICKDVRRTDGQ